MIWQCASAPPVSPTEKAEQEKALKSFFLEIRLAISRGDAGFIYNQLSRESQSWFRNISIAAESEPLSFLRDRPFFEVLSVLALRVDERVNPGLKRDPVSLLERMVIQTSPVKRNILKHRLGNFRISRHSAGLGIHKAPNVPVFFFIREGGDWRFDLVKSFPLILLGAENIARQKRDNVVDQAVYILEKTGSVEVLPQDIWE